MKLTINYFVSQPTSRMGGGAFTLRSPTAHKATTDSGQKPLKTQRTRIRIYFRLKIILIIYCHIKHANNNKYTLAQECSPLKSLLTYTWRWFKSKKPQRTLSLLLGMRRSPSRLYFWGGSIVGVWKKKLLLNLHQFYVYLNQNYTVIPVS